MIVFREDLYGADILTKNKYRTGKRHGFERCVLVRYMANNGYSKEEIISSLKRLSKKEFMYTSEVYERRIYNRIYNKALEYEYIKDKEVIIYKSEIDTILSIPDKKERDLLFVCLVFYKWAKTIEQYKFYDHFLNKTLVEEHDNDMIALARLKSLRNVERKLKFNYLIKNHYYEDRMFKGKSFFYIPFAVDAGEVAFTIDNFDDLIYWLYWYIEPTKYKRCIECGRMIKKTTGSKKYCGSCACYVANQKKEKRKVQTL